LQKQVDPILLTRHKHHWWFACDQTEYTSRALRDPRVFAGRSRSQRPTG